MLPKLELHRGSFMEFSSGTRLDISKRWKKELEEEVERRVRGEHSRQPNTSAHAWMTWNDTQGET